MEPLDFCGCLELEGSAPSQHLFSSGVSLRLLVIAHLFAVFIVACPLHDTTRFTQPHWLGDPYALDPGG